MNFITNAVAKIKAWNAERSWENHHHETLKTVGWDGKCHGCSKWYHTDNVGKFICDSEQHWHFKCTNCGHQAKFFLSIIPIYDGESDAVERDFSYTLYNTNGFKNYRRIYAPSYGGIWPTYHKDSDDSLIAEFKTEVQYCKDIGFYGRVYPAAIQIELGDCSKHIECNSVHSGEEHLRQVVCSIYCEQYDLSTTK